MKSRFYNRALLVFIVLGMIVLGVVSMTSLRNIDMAGRIKRAAVPEIVAQNFPLDIKLSVLPKGAQYVPVLRFYLIANQERTLRAIRMNRISVGKPEYIGTSRLIINGKFIKEKRFSTVNDEVYWDDLDIKLKKKEQILIEANVDFKNETETNLVYQFQIRSDAFQWNERKTVVKGLPVTGPSFSVGNILADQVTIRNAAANISLPLVRAPDQRVSRFVITASKHNAIIRRIVLHQAESLDMKQIKNIRLFVDGEEVSKLESFQNNILDFFIRSDTGETLLIKEKKSKTFSVIADIGNVSKTEKIRLYLENPEDLYAYDNDFASGTRVNNQFSFETAWCAGTNSSTCKGEGFRRKCTKGEKEDRIRECV